jgi:tetratricopeptide (TPR) repeat protein
MERKVCASIFMMSLLTCSFAQTMSPAARKEQIINTYTKEGAWRYPMYSPEWQAKLDEGLKIDSTIAYLWQQKAMPLFKQKKYEQGMAFLNKAVKFEPDRWLDYRAFIKCIFSKDYRGSIEDFNTCLAERGNSYVMDHSYRFYIALCHLQLKKFALAEKMLTEETNTVSKERGEQWVHHLDLFYLGVSLLEQKEYKSAIATFDRALKLYPKFSDVKFYKAKALRATGREESGLALENEARADFKKGYTINEDNAIYEKYPYQVNWR